MQRYVVTGLGIVCALGNNLAEVWSNAKNGVGGIREVTKLDVSGCDIKYAAELKNFNPTFKNVSKNRAALDDVSIMAIESAYQAVMDARIDLKMLDRTRIGVVTGSCTGGIKSFERIQRDLANNEKKLHPKDVLKSVIHGISGNIANYFRLEGPTANIVNACAAGTISIAYGCSLIENGVADMVIVSGTDAVGGLPFSGFYSLKSLDNVPCSPFSRSSGISLGEGAASLIIESYEHAMQREATIYCEVVGYGICSDAYHITAPRPDGDGQINAIRKAMEQAGLDPCDIDYLNAHGTGTALNDSAEQAALKAVFKNAVETLSISSSKSMTGHCLGAAGAIEAVLSIKCLKENYVIPTVNFTVSGASHFDFVPNAGKEKPVDYAMSNSLAFGGDNSSVVFGKRVKNAISRSSPSGRVFITGLGIVSPVGVGLQEYWGNLELGKNGITRITSSNEDSPCKTAGVVDIDDFTKYGIGPGALRKMDRITKLLITAGSLAMADAALMVDESNRYDIGAVVGTSDGPITDTFHFQDSMIKNGFTGARAFLFPNTVYNAAAGYFAQHQGLRGYVTTFSNGALSGISSLCCGYDLLRTKLCKAVIAAGVDEYSEYIHMGYELVNALYKGEEPFCRPYSFQHDGFIIGEGSCALSLELGENALKREARCYAEVIGYGMANFPVKPGKIHIQGTGLDKAVANACKKAHVSMDEIDAIVGFGNGSRLLDQMELNSYSRLFGNRLEKVPVFTIKSYVGESRAAASALQIAHAALMLNKGTAPVTRRGYQTQYSLERKKINLIEESQAFENVLVTGFAFGGGYNAVILRRVENF